VFCTFSPIQSQNNDLYTKIKADLYSGKLILAKQELNNALKDDPNNPFLIELENHYDLLQITFYENHDHKSEWEKKYSLRLEQIKNSDCPQYEKEFLLSESHLISSVLHLFSGNYIKAVSLFKTGFKHYKQLEEINPTLTTALKMKGVYHFLLGSVPIEYEWLLKTLGMKGDYKIGLMAIKKWNSTSIELGDIYESYFYNALFSSFRSDDAAQEFPNYCRLPDSMKRNPIIRQGISLLAESVEETDSCLNTLLEYEKFDGDTHLGLLDLHLGHFLLYQLNPKADKYLIKYLNTCKDLTIRTDTYRYLFWYYSIFNNSEKANYYKTLGKLEACKAKTSRAKYIFNEL
ncbi:MAG: hypothetical protein MI717_09325, partial [Spirochaetales bacterium]|nr:hypothetical protein [Spirochaetales bacterium]